MWRFLNNIPRALKNCYAPRATVGVYVETDEKDQDASGKSEKEIHLCDSKDEFLKHKSYHEESFKDKSILWRLVNQKGHRQSIAGEDLDNEAEEHQTDQEGQHDWWKFCPKDRLAFLQASNQSLEAFLVGSGLLWTSNHKQRTGKVSDLVYRVLYLVSDKKVLRDEATCETCIKQAVPSCDIPRLFDQSHRLLAIKDAEGSAQDKVVNTKKSESLDAAMRGFEYVCMDYTAHNESLLGLMAADKGDLSEAVEHFRVSCSMGNKTACYNLGLWYESGTGVKTNIDMAKKYYELAAEKGHVQAMYNLSLLYLDPEEGEDKIKALYFMEMAARSGLAQAQTYMGVYLMEVGNAKKAAAYFKAAADQNDTEAQYFLGVCHEFGIGLETNECRAAYLYSLAAKTGHDRAIYSLGTFNEKGLAGIPCDIVTAMELYNKAADMGNDDAKCRIEELKTLKATEEPSAVICDMEGQEQVESPSLSSSNQHPSFRNTITTPSSPNSHGPMHSSLSSPTIAVAGDPLIPLTEFFNQALRLTSQRLFGRKDSGDQDKAQFYIGGGEDVADEVSSDDNNRQAYQYFMSLDVNGAAYPNKGSACKPLYKSNTTPDLSSMVACNI